MKIRFEALVMIQKTVEADTEEQAREIYDDAIKCAGSEYRLDISSSSVLKTIIDK